MLRDIAPSVLFILVCWGCDPGASNSKAVKPGDLKEPLIRENKRITREEAVMIRQYIDRHEWEMKETGTGLRYMIYGKGKGMAAKKGMKATVEFEISLLDGTLCYSSIEKGPRQFEIGKDNVESGIHEGIQYLNVGDRAKFILPSYLAHGLVGDYNKIPPMATLVVDLHLIRLD